jgi:hypothetical protein
LKKWKLQDDVQFVYWDTKTVDGDAEASFYDVGDIPTTIIEKDSKELRRWSGPSADMLSEDVRTALMGSGT